MTDWLGRIQQAVSAAVAEAVHVARTGRPEERAAAKQFLESPELAGVITALSFRPLEVRMAERVVDP
ncbi:MAG: hypothetical protein AB1609_21500 [Bacillota bacterium]